MNMAKRKRSRADEHSEDGRRVTGAESDAIPSGFGGVGGEKWPPDLPEIYDKELKGKVYTHRSFSNQFTFTSYTDELQHNERLEFLGDSMLNYAVTRTIYFRFPRLREGKLSEIRSSLVCNKSLQEYGRLYNMDKDLRLSSGAERDDVRQLDKIIADCFEAYLGAVDLGSGEETVKAFVKALIGPKLDKIEEELQGEVPINKYAKNHLYHLLKGKGVKIEYPWVDGKGGNQGGYTVALKINDEETCRGTATNQKDASLRAAMAALANTDLTSKYL